MQPARRRELAKALTMVESRSEGWRALVADSYRHGPGVPTVGITGPPGCGKSTLVDAMVLEWAGRGEEIAVLSIDPSSPFSGGAVLGDRVRMRRSEDLENVFIRSMSARGHAGGLNEAAMDLRAVLAGFDVDRIIVETVGAGQNDVEVASVADCVVVVSVPGLGDSLQAAKAGLLEIGDIHVVNKADLPGAPAVQRDLTAMLELAFPGRPGANEAQESGRRAAGPPQAARRRIEARFGTPDAEAFWHPPVLSTVATDAATVRDVNGAVDACVAWLRTGSRGSARASERAHSHLQAIVKNQLFFRVLGGDPGESDSPLTPWVRRIVEGGIDPYAAADHLVGGAGRRRRCGVTQEIERWL
jgi:LAO/AO transport system kinase